MRETAIRAGRVLGLAALGACPLLIHAALATGYWTMIAAVLSALQVLLIAGIMLARSAHRYVWWAATAMAGLLLFVVGHSAQQSLLATSGISHALVYVGLLALFGSTLIPGREALITGVVRKLHGPVAVEIAAYTRGVTWAWCCFFAGQLLMSLALFLWAPVVVWSFFINVLNFPLVALMFVCEYGYRLARVRNRPRSSLADVIRAFRQGASAASGHTDARRSLP